jgi:transketolase
VLFRSEAIIIATGSEVELAVAACESEALEDKKIRVVSMPCTAVFDRQSQDYRDSVIPPDVGARVVVEAAVTAGWYKYVGIDGIVIGIDTFGESAPAKELFAYFGFTVDKVVEAVSKLLGSD